MRKKFAGIVGAVMLILLGVVSSAFALVYNPDDYQRWADVQISSVFSEIKDTAYDGAFKGNCLQFVRLVIKLDNDAGYNRGWLKTYKWNDDNAHGRLLYDYGGAEIITQHRNDYNGYPTTNIVEEHFSKAHTGDVVQMY